MKRLLITGCVVLLSTSCMSGPAAVEALRIDGVWVFQHEPGEISMTAIHGGAAEIRGECLYVDDAVVVWSTDQIDQATKAIADVQAGQQVELRIGGGGISIDEGATAEDIPAVIADRCPTRSIWYGNL